MTTDSSHLSAEVAWPAMPDAVRGGLFVAAAVVTGLLAGFLVPPLFGAERETARPRAKTPPPPTMPSVIGQPLDEAQTTLRRRGIAYSTGGPEIVKTVMPELLEVCESEPVSGQSVRGTARLHTAVRGTCDL